MTKYLILVALFIAGLIISSINPHDYFNWILEVSPAILGFVILVFTFKKFRFTGLTYLVILIFCFILFTGAHYHYSRVPVFDRVKEVFHQNRNSFDKLAHFALGFVAAMIVREFLVRWKIINGKPWLKIITVCLSMALSALFEVFEWFGAIASGQSADKFLGAQGYEWDTQSDMLYALIGAVCMVIFMSKMQDRQIEKSDD
jgi:putative membrane protein